MELPVIALLCLMSFLAGFIDSIAGGGGLILLPSLLVAGIPPQLALGTNKLAGTCGTAMALLNFVKNGKVIWKLALVGVGFSIVGSTVGTKTILLCDQETTAKIIIALLPITAIITFLPKRQLKTTHHDLSQKDIYLFTPLICFAFGFYDGFFGPGTGTFLTFAFYAFLGLHLINASAITKVFNLSSNVGSLATFALADKVLYGIGIPIAVCNLAGGYLGSLLAIRKGHAFIQFFLLLVFGLLFVTLLHKAWRG